MKTPSFIGKTIRVTKRAFSFLRQGLKEGGVVYANISQLNKGESLLNKSILVTGGSSGIGFAIAKKALEEGAKVVITGRSYEKLIKAKAELKSESLFIITWDVSDIKIISEKLDEASRLVGNEINILVNNAGILLNQKFFSVTEDVWDKTYATNSKSIYFISQEISSRWIANKVSGKIINVSSTSAFYGTTIPYGATKWDVAGLTEGLAKKLYGHRIIVNGIAPGRTATEMLSKANSENIYDSYTSAQRYGLPIEIAELASFLMSDATNFIVGQTIICDGGYTL